jgi:hypothetical protein
MWAVYGWWVVGEKGGKEKKNKKKKKKCNINNSFCRLVSLLPM